MNKAETTPQNKAKYEEDSDDDNLNYNGDPLYIVSGNEDIPESAFCGMLESGQNGFPIWEVSTCVFFIIPMAIIMVLYMRIGMRIRSRTKHTQALGEYSE